MRAQRLYPFLVAFALALAGRPVFAANIPVTTINDSGAGSLRDALTQSNALPGPDIIDFILNGTPPFTISVTTPLPAITDTKLAPVVPAQHIELPALSGSAGIDALFLGSEGEGQLRVFLFDAVSGAPLRGTLTEVCNPCSLEVDAASRLSRLSLQQEIQAAGGLDGDVSASATILVAGELESVAVAPVENKGGARPLLPFADTICP